MASASSLNSLLNTQVAQQSEGKKTKQNVSTFVHWLRPEEIEGGANLYRTALPCNAPAAEEELT
jgi:hypothetical protein